MAGIQGYYRVLRHSKEGKLLFDSGLMESKSFVIAFSQSIYALLIETNFVGVMDTANLSQTILPNSLNSAYLAIDGLSGNSAKGPVVGSGTNAVTNADYALQSLIATGVGAGQLSYQATGTTAPAVVGANVDLVVTRSFYNGSGGNVSVNEIGIYCHIPPSGGAQIFCIIRDVLGATQTVANTQTLTIQYTLRTTA